MNGPLRGSRDDLQAMKRALARAPLGPKATLALTHAIIALEDELETPAPVALPTRVAREPAGQEPADTR